MRRGLAGALSNVGVCGVQHDESTQMGEQASVPTSLGTAEVAAAAADTEATSLGRQDSAQQLDSAQQQPQQQPASGSHDGAGRKRQRGGQQADPTAQLAAAAMRPRLPEAPEMVPAATKLPATGEAAASKAREHAAAAASAAQPRPQGSAAPRHSSDALKQAAAAASLELPPSRPMAEFLADAGAHHGEDSFRVLCQVRRLHLYMMRVLVGRSRLHLIVGGAGAPLLLPCAFSCSQWHLLWRPRTRPVPLLNL